MDIHNTLLVFIWNTLDGLDLGHNQTILLERPADMSHGDFSTNIAMVLARTVGKSPVILAREIVDHMNAAGLPVEVARVDVAGPGFINFTVKQSFLSGLVDLINSSESYGTDVVYAGKKILVEHSSPNLFKAFHIGHMMNNTVGESITRLARYSGADVVTMSYPSDISLGIAKAIRVVMMDGIETLHTLSSVDEQAAYLGQCYIRGNNDFREDESVVAECKHISSKLYTQEPSVELDIYTECKRINMEYLFKVIGLLGSQFDAFIYESEAGIAGEQLVRDNINLFTQSNGEVIYEGEQDGLHTRVFINSEGHPTYEAKDLGLLSIKFERYSPDISLFMTDHEQTEYFKVVASVAGKINSTWRDRTIHRTHGRMTFKGQKMSSRLGGVPVATELLDSVIEIIKQRTPDINDDDALIVAVSAIKFMIVRARAGSNINFDPETSLSLEGDTGPYLQYTVVRAKSVLEKVGDRSLGSRVRFAPQDDNRDMILERTLLHFPLVVRQSINEWAPHYVAQYVLELAQTFNSWYGRTRIIDAENPDEAYNIELTRAVAVILENGLYLLGIQIPSKM